MQKIYLALGYSVALYSKTSQGVRDTFWGKIKTFVYCVFPTLGARKFKRAVKKFHPTIIHVHNLYPFIGSAVLKKSKELNIKVVMTVHNYRLVCPTGLFLRNNKPCELCLERGNELSCVRYNCEKNIAKSMAYARRNYISRKRAYFLNYVDKYCCLTDFQRQKLAQAGYDKGKIIVIPNSIKLSATKPIQGSYIGICGRISNEKGIDLILEIAKKFPFTSFKFAGSISKEFSVKDAPKNCNFMGELQGIKLKNFYRQAKIMLFASYCYEGLPMTLLEAASYGIAVVAPNHGAFTHLTHNSGKAIGVLFESGNGDDLEKKIRELLDDKDKISAYGHNGMQAVKEKYSNEKVKQMWKELIEELTNAKQV